MKYEEMGYDPKDLGNYIVDSKSAGLTICPICKNHSVNEEGWCYNGCNRNCNRKDD